MIQLSDGCQLIFYWFRSRIYRTEELYLEWKIFVCNVLLQLLCMLIAYLVDAYKQNKNNQNKCVIDFYHQSIFSFVHFLHYIVHNSHSSSSSSLQRRHIRTNRTNARRGKRCSRLLHLLISCLTAAKSILYFTHAHFMYTKHNYIPDALILIFSKNLYSQLRILFKQ